ncbi:MAG: RNA polymerase subunit sigma [Clostridia bacterium]|nr:RNA polymerase subunit sigma [Clostridia bacterium]
MSKAIDELIYKIKTNNDAVKLNEFISQYEPFVLRVIIDTTNAYVDRRNDEIYSIGLIAFNEAITRYEIEKGDFLSYARLVISSRIKSFKRQSKPLELDIENTQVYEKSFEDQYLLKQEIEAFEKVLESFEITFEDLADASPKHEDTRNRAKSIGIQAAHEKDLVKFLYDKKRLPIAKIAERFFISVKIIKRSKKLISAVIIIIEEQFDLLFQWILPK